MERQDRRVTGVLGRNRNQSLSRLRSHMRVHGEAEKTSIRDPSSQGHSLRWEDQRQKSAKR